MVFALNLRMSRRIGLRGDRSVHYLSQNICETDSDISQVGIKNLVHFNKSQHLYLDFRVFCFVCNGKINRP